MFKHLLVPTDGSPLAQAAVARAILLARDAKAGITFVCVERRLPTMYLGAGAISDGHALHAFHEREDSAARQTLATCQQLATTEGVDCDVLALASDEPYEAIIAAAQRVRADLIVMASHGYRGVKALILGSQTQKVLTHSSIPVLVYR